MNLCLCICMGRSWPLNVNLHWRCITVVVWCSGSMLVLINEVNLHRAWLVLGWVTVSGFISQYATFISICNQPPRSTQPGHPFLGRCNKYQLKGGDALQLGSKGRYGSCVGGRQNYVIPLLHMGHIWALQIYMYMQGIIKCYIKSLSLLFYCCCYTQQLLQMIIKCMDRSMAC